MSRCGHFFGSRDPRPAGSGGAEGEHPLDVPCHGHEAPLATQIVEPAQQELAESKDRFDDAEHWFRDLFAQRIELPAFWRFQPMRHGLCLLYTSDAADDLTRVDLGGCRVIKKKKTE